MIEGNSNPKFNFLAYEIGTHQFLVPSYYTLNESLGNGSFGMVVKGKINLNEMISQRSIKYNGFQSIPRPISHGVLYCAIKKITNIFTKGNFEYQKKMLREIRIMKHLKHRNILSLVDLIPPPDYKSFDDLYLVSEYMECDLDTLIRSKDTVLSDEHIRYFMYQLICGLHHIHEADILHRDLKPANILVNSNCDLKICDFGLSRPVDFHNNPFMSTYYVATRWYRAPELLLGSNIATKAIDIWSIGCIFAELLGRRVLFPGSNKVLHQIELIVSILGTPEINDIKGHELGIRFFQKEINQKHKGVPLSELFPRADPLAIDLLQKMLQFNPYKRITAEQVLQHPYFEGYGVDNTPKVPVFNYEFESNLNDNSDIKRMIWEEIMSFNVEKYLDLCSEYLDDTEMMSD